MLEEKINQIVKKTKIMLITLSMVGSLGGSLVGGCDNDTSVSCTPEEQSQAIDYCYDYLNQYVCNSCETCVYSKDDQNSQCEGHCESDSNNYNCNTDYK